MDTFLQYSVAAAASASIYALVSIGITMIYGVARIMHVAHAILFLLSSFITYELVERGWPYLVATLMSVVLVTALGGVLYVVFFARIRGRPFNSLIVSLGLVVTGEAVLHMVWHLDVHRIDGVLSQAHRVSGVSFTTGAVVTVATTVVLVAGLAFGLRRTGIGRMVRAVAENPDTSQLLGIQAHRLTASIFLAGTATAALAGSLIGTFIPFSAASANTFVLKSFAVAIVGGLGSPGGALAAAALLATAEVVPIAMGEAQWSQPLLFVVLAATLLVRPHGLFGRRGTPSSRHDGLAAGRPRAAVKTGLPLLAGVLGALFLVPFVTNDRSLQGLAAYGVGLAIAAYAVWIPLRFLGVPSLGHAALFGIGAYAAAITVDRWDAPLVLQLGIAVGLAGIAAFVMAAIAMRVDGLAPIAIITLALGGLIVGLMNNFSSLTGGVTGRTVTQPLRVFGREYTAIDGDKPLYFLGLAFLALTVVGCWWFERSRRGAVLLAVRDSASLAASLGLDTYRIKVVVFGVSGAMAGLAGVLFTYFSRYLEPRSFAEPLALNLLLAVLLGGAASIYGPMIGIAVFVLLPYYSPLDGDVDLAFYGGVLIAIASLLPSGLASARSAVSWVRTRSWKPTAAPASLGMPP